MSSTITASVNAEESKPAETVHRPCGGIKIGLADGMYEFKKGFGKKFGDMDAEVAELFK